MEHSIRRYPHSTWSLSTVSSRDTRIDEDERSSFHRNLVDRYSPLNYTEPKLDEYPSKPSTVDKSCMKSRFHRLSTLVGDWWLYEILSLLSSAACIFAIVVLLGMYNHRKLPTRWALDITLNAYISMLAAGFKFSLAIPVDEAFGQLKWLQFHGQSRPIIEFEHLDQVSRGPCGALKFIWRSKGRRIASIGASVTVLSLALDPFFQQLVRLPSRSPSPRPTDLPRSRVFEIPERYETINGSRMIPADLQLWNVLDPFYRGHGIETKTPFTCPANDCTWPSYQTLATCSSCADVSQYLTFGCRNERGDWMEPNLNNSLLPAIVQAPFQEPDNTTTIEACGWFFNASGPSPVLMNGYTIDRSHSPSAQGQALVGRILNMAHYTKGLFPWGGSLQFKETHLRVADFIVVSSPDAGAVYANKTPSTAVECVLKWCVKTMSASYSNGIYQEKVESTTFNESITPFPWVLINMTNGLTSLTGGTSLRYKYNWTLDSGGEQFFISNVTQRGALRAFQPFLTQYITAPNATTPLRTADERVTYNVTDSPFIRANVTAYVEELANALTWVLRTYPNSTEKVPGSIGQEVYISVSWSWLVLPIMLWMAAATFLMYVIAQASRHDMGLHKNSALAVLYHGFTDETRTLIGQPDNLHDLEERARHFRIQFDTRRPVSDGRPRAVVGQKSSCWRV